MQSVTARFAIIEAPSPLGLRPEGVEELAGDLLNKGFAQRLGARNAGVLTPPPYDNQREPETDFLNAKAVMRYSTQLSDRVNEVLDRSEFPIVLGGDCSILLGNLLALKRRGRYGLLFIDGHTDFYQADANINGEIASSELAIAMGREPKVLHYVDEKTLVLDEDVVAFGFRDEAEQRQYGSQPLPPSVMQFDLEAIRSVGIASAATAAVSRLTAVRDGFWIHLDADVLDDAIMPAVDYRMDDGFTWSELTTTLRTAMATRRCVGLDVAIFNPRLDTDGQIAKRLVDVLVNSLKDCDPSTSIAMTSG
ncbi:MAG TPA: arginase family protein [Steroidobacteraceae bacterium]|nr:arginase family protein [Steroidobacteraceae bacterium]